MINRLIKDKVVMHKSLKLVVEKQTIGKKNAMLFCINAVNVAGSSQQ